MHPDSNEAMVVEKEYASFRHAWIVNGSYIYAGSYKNVFEGSSCYVYTSGIVIIE